MRLKLITAAALGNRTVALTGLANVKALEI